MAKVLDSELSLVEKALIKELDDHIEYFKLVKKSLPPEIALTKKQYALLKKVIERADKHRHEIYANNIRNIDGKRIEYRGVPVYQLMPKRSNYRRRDMEKMF